MSWQDELQHLDAELAAGRISAEEYRNKRDALSQAGAAASGAGPQAGGAGAQQPPAAEEPPAAQGEVSAAQSGSGQSSGGPEQAATGSEATVQHQQPAFPSEEPSVQRPPSQPAVHQTGGNQTGGEQTGGDEPTLKNQPTLPPEGQQPPSQPAPAQQTGQQAGADQAAVLDQQAVPPEGHQAPQSPGQPAAGTGPHSIDSSTTDPGVSGNFAGHEAPGHGTAAQPPAQQQSPFPPAFSWNAASNQQPQQPQPPQPTPEETTQVVPNVMAQTGSAPAQPPSDAEQTQTVNINQIAQHQPPHQFPPKPPQNQPGPLGQQLNPQTGPSPVPPAAPQQQVWPEMHGQSNHGWGSSSGTPWDESDLPPAPEQSEPSWMRQGPEVFETAGQSSGKGKWIGISLGAVVVVAGVIIAVFLLIPFGNQGDPQADPPSKPPPPTTSALPKPPPEKSTTPEKPAEVLIPAPEGPKHSFTGPLKPKELEGSKGGLLPEPVRDFAVTNGFVEGFFNGTVEKPQTTLLAMKMPSEDDAHGLAESYLEGQEGLTTEESLSYQGVKVVSTGGGVFRTAYTTHEWTVIIEVNSSDNAEALFTDMLDQQLEQSPPTVLK